MPKTNVGAGCAVAVFNKNREFVMIRRHVNLKHVPGAYCFPGGWIEDGETMLEAGRREVMEEIGCRVKAIKVIGVADIIKPQEAVYSISALMVAILADGETPKNMEPQKSDTLITLPFSKWDDMPRPIMCDYAANSSKYEIEKFLQENIK
jgi:8-oxo-dGTP pyrophosphatase MutT (NUDIX family)